MAALRAMPAPRMLVSCLDVSVLESQQQLNRRGRLRSSRSFGKSPDNPCQVRDVKTRRSSTAAKIARPFLRALRSQQRLDALHEQGFQLPIAWDLQPPSCRSESDSSDSENFEFRSEVWSSREAEGENEKMVTGRPTVVISQSNADVRREVDLQMDVPHGQDSAPNMLAAGNIPQAQLPLFRNHDCEASADDAHQNKDSRTSISNVVLTPRLGVSAMFVKKQQIALCKQGVAINCSGGIVDDVTQASLFSTSSSCRRRSASGSSGTNSESTRRTKKDRKSTSNPSLASRRDVFALQSKCQ